MRVQDINTGEVRDLESDVALRLLMNGEATPVVTPPPVERAVAPQSELR